MAEAYVWALDTKRQILVTDDPGPPVGGRLIGSYPIPESGGWGEAQEVAQRVANHDPEKPYEIVHDAPLTGPSDDDRVCTGCDEVVEECTCENEDDEREELMLSCPDKDCIFQGPHYPSECFTAEQMAEMDKRTEEA